METNNALKPLPTLNLGDTVRVYGYDLVVCEVTDPNGRVVVTNGDRIYTRERHGKSYHWTAPYVYHHADGRKEIVVK